MTATLEAKRAAREELRHERECLRLARLAYYEMVDSCGLEAADRHIKLAEKSVKRAKAKCIALGMQV